METPQEDLPAPWDCRVWVKAAVRLLNDKKILKCDKLHLLLYELEDFANDARNWVELGGEYKIVASEYSA